MASTLTALYLTCYAPPRRQLGDQLLAVRRERDVLSGVEECLERICATHQRGRSGSAGCRATRLPQLNNAGSVSSPLHKRHRSLSGVRHLKGGNIVGLGWSSEEQRSPSYNGNKGSGNTAPGSAE